MSWILIGLYNFFYLIGWTIYLPYLVFVRGRGIDYTKARFSPPSLSSKKRCRIWIHAVSVGETNVALTLARVFCEKADVVISTSTPTGMENLRKKAKNLAVFYAPWDVVFVIDRFIDRIQPDVLVVIETELWPSLFFAVKKKGIPIYVVNARISDRALKRYNKIRFLLPYLVFRWIDKVLCQDRMAEARFISLGIEQEKIKVVGNIKFDIEIDRKQLPPIAEIRESRFVIVLGSTHPDEEKMLISALKRRWRDNWLVISAPRHVERANEVSRIVAELDLRGISYTHVKEGSDLSEVNVLVIDVIGILAYIYRYADVVFIGGSLVNRGGQNPLEVAYWGKPIFFGPHMENFSVISQVLIENGGACRVRDAAEFVELMCRENLVAMGRRAKEVLEKNRGAARHTAEEVLKEC